MMASATAASTVSIEPLAAGTRVHEINDALIQRYLRLTRRKEPELYSATPLPETEVYRPRHISPRWLPRIEAIIIGSIADETEPAPAKGRRVRQEVATAAIQFFQETADLLPGEPHIYSSTQGDLVAEFKAPRGTLTSVVSPNFVVLFAVVDDVPIHKQISPSENVRLALTGVTKPLFAGMHGDLATKK